MKGTVKFFNEAKGFGFITPENPQQGGRDIFVHITGLADANNVPKDGETVSFEVKDTPKGLSAVNVKSESVTA